MNLDVELEMGKDAVHCAPLGVEATLSIIGETFHTGEYFEIQLIAFQNVSIPQCELCSVTKCNTDEITR